MLQEALSTRIGLGIHPTDGETMRQFRKVGRFLTQTACYSIRGSVDWGGENCSGGQRSKTNMTLTILVDLATALGVHPRILLNKAEMTPAKPGRPLKRRVGGKQS